MRYWIWRFRGFLYLLSLNVREIRKVWRERWYIRQAWRHAMTADSWREFYKDDYSPREALNEDASHA